MNQIEPASVIKSDGTITFVLPDNGTDFTLEELLKHCECDTITMVSLQDGRWMVADDNGKLGDTIAINKYATTLYQKGRVFIDDEEILKSVAPGTSVHVLKTGLGKEFDNAICGTVLVCEKNMIK